jgi:hypothetical protein
MESADQKNEVGRGMGNRSSASSAAEPGGSWRAAFRRVAGPSCEEEQLYVRTILGRYLWLPMTPTRAGRDDRRCARALYARGIPQPLVERALLLAAARRTFRSADAEPLPAIRGLRYFLPIVDELLASDIAPDYAQYLIDRLRPLAEAKGGFQDVG